MALWGLLFRCPRLGPWRRLRLRLQWVLWVQCPRLVQWLQLLLWRRLVLWPL